MTEAKIHTAAEAATDAVFDSSRGIRTNVVGTGEHLQLIWAKYEPGASYTLHAHPHEQFSVLLQGRLRLTVGDEVRDIGPGDMWYAPANVVHGGEILGEEARGLHRRLRATERADSRLRGPDACRERRPLSAYVAIPV